MGGGTLGGREGECGWRDVRGEGGGMWVEGR